MNVEYNCQYARNSIYAPIRIKDIVTIFRMTLEATRNNPSESHDFPEIIYVESGEFDVKLNETKEARVNPGEIICFAPNTVHGEHVKKSKATVYILSFDTFEPIQYDIFDKPIRLSAKQRLLISDAFTVALSLLKKKPINEPYGMILESNGDPFAFQKIKCSLELLLIELCEAEAKRRESVEASNSYNAKSMEFITVSEFLKNNITSSFSVEDIANECAFSVSKLKKVFLHERCGGVINYFNTLKINEAKRLMRTSTMNITQISNSLGFSTIQSFHRVFKSKTGMSPSKYAKSIDKS